MNYPKGSQRPESVLVRLDPNDAQLLDELRRALRQRTPQAAIITAVREFARLREQTQEERVEQIEWKQLYFELAESTSALKMTAENLLQQIHDADTRATERRPHLSVV